MEKISGHTVHRKIDSYPIHFTRRRYGQTIYTWVSYYSLGWVDLGDPWPCVNPPEREIKVAIAKRENVDEKKSVSR